MAPFAGIVESWEQRLGSTPVKQHPITDSPAAFKDAGSHLSARHMPGILALEELRQEDSLSSTAQDQPR